ncbi:DUF4232 domain-containing protein [Streptomyces sp. NBC_01006]|uniref:DUF4232 domain-containing protein n=1 Tax=Streptomyces sp. NBC_01006 TaxID=2903716 RepID=UPI003864EDB4|nr:DUF4232 domain-containing protein [Streptomyces sp. NBC_01006]
MKRSTRCVAIKASSVLLLAGFASGTLVVGSGAAVGADEPRRAAAAPCTSTQVVANSAQPTGPAQVRITVTNKGKKPCVLNGFPTVALAGQGSPDKNKPLQVIRVGKSGPVQLAAGGRASAQLTFTPVLGEGEGYCASGADPFVAPSMVVGVAGARYQLAPSDGSEFALCGTTVRATAFRG